MGLTGIDGSQQYYNQHKKDAILVNVYQKINANNNKSISTSSRNFADAVEAKIISLIRNEKLALVA